MSLERYFSHIGYREDPQIVKEYSSNHRTNLLCRYHGMGHMQVIGVDPTIKDDKRYFIGILGGSNGYDSGVNDREFRSIGDLGTKYFTLDELCRIALESINGEIYQYNSAPV